MRIEKALVLWFTGLSGAGKTTVADAVCDRLRHEGYRVLVLDGDDVRAKLHVDLGFSRADIIKNNALIADLCVQNEGDYDVIAVPIISPFRESRLAAREKIGPRFFEIFLSADLQCVSRRDVKGLYEKASKGEISNMIGASRGIVYEPPENADLVLASGEEDPDSSVLSLYTFTARLLSG